MAPGSYETFELLIDQGQDSLVARVIRSPAGDARADFVLPFDEDVLTSFLADGRRDCHGLAANH
ncbi:MAG: hypothetical protein H6646_08985 [Anaerolineales bacterium]|nr:hypothetical protein [Anaerolineales bacterium]